MTELIFVDACVLVGDPNMLAILASEIPPTIPSEVAFQVCVCLAALVGIVLALLDDGELKTRGGSPTSHCVDCADVLWFGGPGLGRLGLDAAVGSLCAGVVSLASSFVGVACAGCRRLGSKGKNVPKDDTPKPPAELEMTLRLEFHAYWGYFRLFCMGLFREFAVKVKAVVCQDPACQKYLKRERWNSGLVEFYMQHMYRNMNDCFQRPIASAPNNHIDVVKREREGGVLFGPLHEFKCLAEVRRCTNLASYNYLGFGGVDEFCTPAARECFLQYGFSAGGCRTEGGTLPVHRELETEVAHFLGKEDALVLGMGFATNSTILPALFEARPEGPGVLVLSDELNHRSIVEGVRLSGATVRAFAHNNMAALEEHLRSATEKGQPNGVPWRKVFIVVEGIYSMEGDFCRLREIVSLKNQYKAYLYLDEAHSIGAVGPTGRGVAELFGVPTSEVDVMMGTFTKSFGSAGGYVAASRAVIDVLRQTAPGSVFGSAMPPPCAAQALAAFRCISGAIGGTVGKDKLVSIRKNANFFRKRLLQEGFTVLGDVDSPIIPVLLFHPEKIATFSRKCMELGIAVVVVGYPAVPVLSERVRFCMSAAHTLDQLEDVAVQLAAIGEEVGILYQKGANKQEKADRDAQALRYADWLRKAPLRLSGANKTESAASIRWSPEQLAPKISKTQANQLAMASATTAESRTSVDFRIFDPLGYISRPLDASQRAAEATLDLYGFGACGPRGFYGTTKPHLELEEAIAKHLGVEAAILYSAGVATASSVLPALVQKGDRVIVDSGVSLGIKAGLRLCRAEVSWVPHCDPQAIETALCRETEARMIKKSEQRIFIVVEALCQRTGRLAPLAQLIDLKTKHGALLILDESVSMGVLGENGRGLCESSGVDIANVDAIIGSLELNAAGVGGFCAGRLGLVEHQRLAGAGYCFSASSPPASCSAAAAVLKDMGESGGVARRGMVVRNAELLHSVLQAAVQELNAPLELISSQQSYIQHIRWVGDEVEAEQQISSAVARVAERRAGSDGSNIQVQFCSSVTCEAEAAFDARLGGSKKGAPSLRACVSSEHTPQDIRALGAAVLRAFGS